MPGTITESVYRFHIAFSNLDSFVSDGLGGDAEIQFELRLMELLRGSSYYGDRLAEQWRVSTNLFVGASARA